MSFPSPEIRQSSEKLLVGKSIEMSLAQNQTGTLWQAFMPLLNKVSVRTSSDKISMAVYPEGYFETFHPTQVFTKWAAVEVSDFAEQNADLETITLPAGLYAVFQYKGSAADTSIFQYIFGTWLPASQYVLDNRPHFEILGEKYRNQDPNSEEEIWVPVKTK